MRAADTRRRKGFDRPKKIETARAIGYDEPDTLRLGRVASFSRVIGHRDRRSGRAAGVWEILRTYVMQIPSRKRLTRLPSRERILPFRGGMLEVQRRIK
jgi:hypothetical protein